MQEREDNAYLLRRDNEMRQKLNDLLYNPTNGLANQKGHNAQGVTGMFDEEVEKLTQQFMSDVGNPNMQARFQERVAQWLPGYRKNIAVHEGNEVFSANKLDIDTGIQDEIDSALRRSSADSANILYNALGRRIGDLQNVLGMSREAAAEYVQEKYSAGILQMVTELSKTSDTYNLMGVYDAVKDKVTGEVRAKIGALAGVAKLQDEAYREVEVYLKDPSFYVNGVLQPDLVRKAYQEDHNEYENVFVADGNADFSDLNTNNPDVGRIWDWFIAHGYSPEATAGIMGRMQQEHNFQTSDVPLQYIEGIGEVGGLGMFQFTKGRAEAFRKWAGENGYSTDSALAQLEYMYNIDRPNQSFTGHTFDPAEMNQLDRYGAAKLWTDSFERGATGEENRYADELFSKHSGRPATGGHYEQRRKYNQVKEDAFMAEVMRRAKESEAGAKQAIAGYINQLLADPDIKNVRDPAVLREKMERLGVPQYWQKDVLNGVSFEVGINNQSVEYQRGEKRYNQQQAADEAYNWYSNKILSGETVTKSEFAQQDFAGGLSGHNKATFLNMIDNEEKAAAKNTPNWFKGQTLSTFNSACAQHDVKGDLRGNAIDSINQLQQEVWEKEHRALTNHEIIDRVREISMTKEMDDGWGPFNWGSTKYRYVEDPEVMTNENGEKVVVGLEDE